MHIQADIQAVEDKECEHALLNKSYYIIVYKYNVKI